MKVRMIETETGSPDGMGAETYGEGKTYEVPPHLGQAFLRMGVAEEVEEKPADPDFAPERRETKPQEAPETKPSGPDEEKSSSPESPDEDSPEGSPEDEVTKEPTSEGSPYFQFRWPDGDLVTMTEDGDEKPVTVLGKDDAEVKRKELQKGLDDANEEEA